ncbi:hypothetical protein IFO70_27595 [Phormidium tenue FACHB-886]|nr:hypothetical protein [Phormidium tenue FACHB-886]
MVYPHDSIVMVGRVVGLSSIIRPIAQCSEEKAIGYLERTGKIVSM